MLYFYSSSALHNLTNTNIAAMTSLHSYSERSAMGVSVGVSSLQGGASPAPGGGLTTSAYNNNKIRFHECRGSLIKLSNNHRTAERRRPYDEFNNGVVMTHRPLRDNELFEIRIDRLVDKWSGSIEVRGRRS